MHKGLLHQADDHLRLPRREHLQAIIDSVRTLTTNNQAEKLTERFALKGEDLGRRQSKGEITTLVKGSKRSKEYWR